MISADEQRLANALAVLAVSRRDEAAWETVFRQMWPFVRTIVYRRLGSVEGLADDAAQEVFSRLLRSCPFSRLREPDAFRGYVWRVSDNVARTYRRRLLLRPTTPLPAAEHEEAALADTITARRLHGDLELKQLLHQEWRELGGSDRRVLRLLVEGHSIGEIAAALGVSYGAAAVRLMRLRIRLRKSLVLKGIMVARPARAPGM